MAKNTFRLPVVVLVVLFCTILAVQAFAQSDNGENVDEIIEGFENGKAQPGGELEELKQGFESEPDRKAETRPEKDGILEGFEGESAEPDEQGDALPERPSSWSLGGELAFTGTYNVSPDAESPWRGVSALRSELELSLEGRFSDDWRYQISGRGFYDAVYALRGRGDYTDEVLDEYEKEIEFEDTFILGRLTDRLDAKLGRQIVVWGTLDNLRVTDVLNPLDLRIPGLTDIDDLRLPVTMAKLDYYWGDWNLSGIALPEVRFSKRPVFGSDFFPAPTPRPSTEEPDEGFERMQFAAALTGVFSGWDIGFYWADIYADQPYAKRRSTDPGQPTVLQYPRINVLGSAANLAAGNWLLKAEAAWLNGLRYTNTPQEAYDRLDAGAGVEYSGFSEAIVSLEAANRHLIDYDARLKQSPDDTRENAFQWAFRLTKDFLNDTLTLSLLTTAFGIIAEDGAFERLDAEYDISDAVSIRGGVVLYQSGDKGLFRDAGDNDRLFAIVTYNF